MTRLGRIHARRARAVWLAAIAAALLATVPAQQATAKRAPAEFFGVSAVNPDAADYERMGSSDVGTYRMLLLWPTVQPTRQGGYGWSIPDREIAAAAANGMQPFPFVYGSPRFAAGNAKAPPLGSASAREAWQAFLNSAVRRYGPGGEFWAQHPEVPYRPVRAWQLWNEQNSNQFFKPRPSPRKYATLLRLSSTAIRKADPRARVVLGGMFGFPSGRGSLHMRDFLKRLYRGPKVRRHFDGVALHPYGGSMRLLRYQIKAARRIMNRNGDKGEPIWVTEIGWATEGPPKWQLVTGQRGQAKRLRRAFGMLLRKRHRWGIKRVIWFVWRDFEQGGCRWCGGAGLIRRNGDPKRSWHAFTRFSARTR